MSEQRAPSRGADELLRAMVDAVEAGCLAVDGDGEVLAWNEALADRLRYASADPPSLSLDDVVATADSARPDGDEVVTVDLVTADGEPVPHELRWETHGQDEPLHVGVARKVSERRDRARQLERFETMLETVTDGVYTMDEDLRFTYVNPAMCGLTGRAEAELLGSPVTEFMHREADVDRAGARREAALAGEAGSNTFTGRVETPDGDERILQTHYRSLDPAADEWPGSVGVVRDITDRLERERERDRERGLLRGILNTIPDVVFAFDEEGEPIAEDLILEEFAGYSRAEIRESDPVAFIAEEDRPEIEAAIAEVLAEGGVVSRQAPLVTKDGERIPYEFRATRFELDDDVLGLVGTGRDVSERVERERALERQRDELATIADITELILEITRELLETPSRRDVERIVCERLADADHYKFAWIGEQAVDDDRFVPRVTAGADEGYVEAVTVPTGGEGAAGRAWRTGEVQVARTDDDEAFAPPREAAAERGIEAVAAIPLQHRATVYGVLGVYATDPDAFTGRKVDAFRVLGETVGFVINAIKRRRLLFAESVTDLDLSLGEASSAIARLAADLDATVSLEGYVSLDEHWVCYLDVGDAAPAAAVDALAGDPAVRSARVVADGTDRRRVEVDVADASLFEAADAVGATVREARATGERARATLEVPGDADVRETVDLLTDVLPVASLVAKRERDRRPGGPGGPDTLLGSLTDRQREALTVAYRAGYYQWPRESTAEEVARTLDISTATLHGHLRKAEQALFSGLLGED